MKFDEIVHALGDFGLYQKKILFLTCLSNIPGLFFLLNGVFLLAVPKHRCSIPGYENDTYTVQNDFHKQLINLTIPPPTDERSDYDKCHMYDVMNNSIRLGSNLISCSSWVYDDSIFTSTFTSQENLVCGNEVKASNAQMVFYAGVLLGSFVLGSLSDIIGRKRTLCGSMTGVVACALGLSWSPSYAVFCVIRFINGFFSAGTFLTNFIIGMELVGPSKRLWAGLVGAYFGTVGELMMTGIAYGLRDWKYIEITLSAICGLFLTYWWILPESARWLLSQGRVEEATKIIEKAAKVNKVSIPKIILDKEVNTEPKVRVWHLFSSRVLGKRSLIIFFNWTVISMVFYGLALNTGNLSGNFYLNFSISAFVEIPATTLCLLALDRVGRRKLHATCMIIGGVACISAIFTTLYASKSLSAITTTLAMIGKLGATAAFAIIYIWSSELFPTVVRNAGFGASSACARIGSMLAPYIADLKTVIKGDIGYALPLVIFGTASVLGGLLSLLLPETLNQDMPETLEDGKHIGSNKSKNRDKLEEKHVGGYEME